jgi:hypothetical protein
VVITAHINKVKSTNAAVIMADGPSLAKEGVSFRDISGFLGRAIFQLRKERAKFIFKNPKNILSVLPPANEQILDYAPTRRKNSSEDTPSMLEAFVRQAGAIFGKKLPLQEDSQIPYPDMPLSLDQSPGAIVGETRIRTSNSQLPLPGSSRNAVLPLRGSSCNAEIPPGGFIDLCDSD